MKNKRPNLNTLPWVFVLVFGIVKSRMWHSSSNGAIGVKAFDKHDFIWALLNFEVPPMRWIGLDSPSFPLVVRVDHFCRDEIRLRD